MQHMQIISIRGMERHVQELAMSEGLTVYDASYLAVAEKSSLVLVTDDRERMSSQKIRQSNKNKSSLIQQGNIHRMGSWMQICQQANGNLFCVFCLEKDRLRSFLSGLHQLYM